MAVPEKSMDAFREPLPTRRRWEKLLPWFAALILAAGVVAAIVKFVPSTSGTTDSSKTQNPTKGAPNPPKSLPLSKEARDVAGRFILTAVRRQHLAEAWKLSGPE